MKGARIAVLLAAACRPSAPAAPPDRPDEQAVSCIDRWLAERHLNEYGDPPDTMYAGGTPLFNEKTGETTDRVEYLVRKHPELQQACPEEVRRARAP